MSRFGLRNERISQLALADRVLALHKDIHEVLILEDRSGDHFVIGEASRKGVTLLADNINSANQEGLLAPVIILGSASQFGGQQSKLVGIEYEAGGLIFAPLDDNKLLAVSTKSESLGDVWQIISAALPQLSDLARGTSGISGGVTSTAEAESRARYFLAGRYPNKSTQFVIDEVSYRRGDQQWEVHGTVRSRIWNLPRRFLVEVDGTDGFVKRYVSSSTSTVLALVATACLIAASLLALILLLTGVWKF